MTKYGNPIILDLRAGNIWKTMTAAGFYDDRKETAMERIRQRIRRFLGGEQAMEQVSGRGGLLADQSGMEMVQVAILVAIAIVLGLIFKTEITAFVNRTFEALNNGF